ncbi:MAG: T9SS type A sorting domain-containing protein [Parafilimonas sp.]|nr:T9SS type A sorting domain-containing protein [Parafilimonas sp.]
MKYKFLPLFILLSAFAKQTTFSQNVKVFAVTGDQFGSVNWIAFRQIDLNGKNPVRTLYVPAESNNVYDAVTGKQISNTGAANLASPAATPQTCGCLNNNMVAAIAYDAKNNRLYYTPMLSNQLRYLDLNSTQPKSYAVTSQLLKNFSNLPGEASIITRMVIASDGYGYALTNDNEHLIRFSTGKQVSITDLGNLIDAQSNGENSVKTQFKSWGGDMIADASGNLYLFTMQREIFKINPNTRLATFVGEIKNMPEDYTVNAAMVENSENIIVGSSTKTTSYYRVNLNTLEATELNKQTAQVYNVSDFANANLAFSANTSNAVAKSNNKSVSIYPNPVNDKKITVQFTNIAKGKYAIQLGELEGKTLLQKDVNIAGSQAENLYVSSISAGTYMLRVLNERGESIYTDKVIISR